MIIGGKYKNFMVSVNDFLLRMIVIIFYVGFVIISLVYLAFYSIDENGLINFIFNVGLVIVVIDYCFDKLGKVFGNGGKE